MGSEITWIKIRVDMFDNRKFKYIRTKKNYKYIELLWIKLLLIAGQCNSQGRIYITDECNYDLGSLSKAVHIDEKNIEAALVILEEMKMVKVSPDFDISIINFIKYQNVEAMDRFKEQARTRQKAHRKSKKTTNEYDGVVVTLSDTLQSRYSHTIEKNRIEYRLDIEEEGDVILAIVFEVWTDQKIMKHDIKTVTTNKRNRLWILNSIAIYGIEPLIEAMISYGIVLNDDKYWFSHRWSMWEFCSRGVDRFSPSSDPLGNFARRDADFKKGSYDTYTDENVEDMFNE